MPRDTQAARERPSFVERHDLWDQERSAAAAEVEARLREDDIQVVRICFADQHGTLRGKTLVAAEVPRALRNGVGAPSSLLLKDTSDRTVFAAFTAGGGVGMAEMAGAADVLMIPDPTTFRRLPWAPHTGWLLSDLRFADGTIVPFSTRDLYRRVLLALGDRDMSFVAGAELEFHLFRLTDPSLDPAEGGQPGAPPSVQLTNKGFQYLSDERYDAIDPICEHLRAALQGLGLPLRSLEIEFGPSQCEVTFGPGAGLVPADMVILARSAIRQVARRHGHQATFMCRPRILNVVSSGWHLHQSLQSSTGDNLFVSDSDDEALSELGQCYLGGLLTHAAAACAFSTPTVNGYKRYRPFSNAPDRAIWGRDNRGVMVRVIGGPGDPATRLENRVGEPAANPYLYMASQIVCGLDGIDRSLDPGAPSDTSYASEAPILPDRLEMALTALRSNAVLRAGFGQAFIDYWLHLKQAELSRFQSEVSDWEQREYFSLF